MVSVVVPSFNYGRYIRQAVESVLGQTYSPIECIVVDDGSTDDTLSVLEGFSGRISTALQTNCGPSAARNAGIQLAKGKYIAFLDADDWWEPAKLEKQMAVLLSDDSIAAVGCGTRRLDGSENMMFRQLRTLSDNKETNLRLVAVRKAWVGGSASGIVADRRLFETSGLFDTELRGAEDWDMWLRIVAAHKVVNLDEPLINRRIHSSGFARDAQKIEKMQWKVYEKAIRSWPGVLDENVRRQMRALIYADAGGELLAARQIDMAIRKYKESLVEWPWSWIRWKQLIRLAGRKYLYKTANFKIDKGI